MLKVNGRLPIELNLNDSSLILKEKKEWFIYAIFGNI